MNATQAYAHCFIANQDDILCGYFLSSAKPTQEPITTFCYDPQNQKVFAVAKCKIVPCKGKEAEKVLRKALNVYLLDKLDKENPNKKIGPFCKETIENFKNAVGYDRPNVKSLVVVEKFEMGTIKKNWKFQSPSRGKHYFVTVAPEASRILADY